MARIFLLYIIYIWVIDQAFRSRWLSIGLFCVLMERHRLKVHKLAKKNKTNMEPSWANKLGQYLRVYWNSFRGNFFCGPQREVPCRRYWAPSRNGSQSQRRNWFILLPHNKLKLLTNSEVKMAGYWPSSFFGIYGPPSPSIQKKPIFSHLARTSLVNNYLLYGKRSLFSWGALRVVPTEQ